MNKVANYIGNLGKSIAYSAVDAVKDNAKSANNFVETNQELFKEIYSSIRSYKTTFGKVEGIVRGSKIYETGDQLKKSLFEDIRTGKFYNKDRQDELDAKAMGKLGDMSMDDIDVSFGDDGDFGAFDPNSTNMDDSLIEKSVKKSAEMTSMTVAKTGEYVAQTQRESTNLLYSQNTQIITTLNSGLFSIDRSISSLVDFANSALQTHAQNSKTYYETSTSLFQEQSALLKEMAEMQRNLYNQQRTENDTSNAKKKIGYDEVVTSEGVPDLKEYGKVIKKNIKNSMGSQADLLFGGGMGEDSNILLSYAAAPLKIIPDYIIKALIPTTLKKVSQDFDKSLSGAFSAVIARLNAMANDPDSSFVSKLFGSIFGIKNNIKSNIETANYKKGSIPFDGVTKKSIVEVIPGYLRKIEAALTNKTERIYDYETGKWTDSNSLATRFTNIRKTNVSNSTSDMKEYTQKYVDSMSFNRKEDRDNLLKGMETIFTKIYEKGGDFRPNQEGIEDKYSEYGVDPTTFAEFIKYWKAMPNSIRMNMAKNIMAGRVNENKQMESIESSGMSPYVELFNKSTDENGTKPAKAKKTPDVGVPTASDNLFINNNMVNLLDNKGHNLYYYLQNILAEIMYIRKFGPEKIPDDKSGNDRTRRGNYGRRGPRPIPPAPNGGNDDTASPDDISSRVRIPDSSAKKKASEDAEKKRKEEDRYKREQEKRRRRLPDILIRDNSLSDDELIRRSGANAKIVTAMNEQNRLKEMQDNESWLSKMLGDKEEDREKRLRDAGLDTENSLLDRLIAADTLGKKWDVISKSLNDIGKKPAEFLGSVMTKADQRLYSLIYGNDDGRTDRDGKPIKGFLDRMIDEMEKTFQNFNNWLTTNILEPLKNKLGIDSFGQLPDKILEFFGIDGKEVRGKIKNKLFGEKDADGNIIKEGILSPYTSAIKRTFKGAYTQTRNAVGDVYNPLGARIFGEELLNGNRGNAELSANTFTGDRFAPGESRDRFRQLISQEEQLEENRDIKGGRRTEESELDKARKKASEQASKINNFADQYMEKAPMPEDPEERKQWQKQFDRAKRKHEQTVGVKSKTNRGRAPEPSPEDKKSKNRQNLSDFEKQYKSNTPMPEDTESKKQWIKDFLQAKKDFKASINYDNIQENASGARYITKSGLTAISKGEMIIPSDQNPLNPDKDKVNRKQEISNEKQIKNKFSNKISKSIFGKIKQNADGDDPIVDGNDESTQDRILSEAANRTKEEVDKVKAGEAPLGKQVIDEGKQIGSLVRRRLLGEKDDSSDFNKAIKDVMVNVKEYAPDAVAGGLLGGGISLVTGAIGGPLLGAAAGAAISIARKSEAVQKMLFGEMDEETGERKGGIVSKDMQDAFKKYFPDMKTFGLAGAVTGLLTPFGPIGGLMIGSAIGYAKNNTYIQEKLFGEEGLIGPGAQDKIKKAFPKMALGAVATMFMGPFGLVGNAMLGSGLGLLSTTDSFKNFMLGEEDENGEREGGLLGAIKESVIDPLKESMTGLKDNIKEFFEENMLNPLKNAIDPITTELKLFFSSLLNFAGNTLNNIFEKTLGIPLDTLIKEKIIGPLTKFTGFLFKTALAPAKFVVSAPFKAMGAIGNSLKQKQIMRGQADYMNAAERLQFREDHKVRGAGARFRRLGLSSGDKFQQFDELLSGMNAEDVDQMKDTMGQLTEGEDYYKKQQKKATKDVAKDVMQFFDDSKQQGFLSPKNRTDILKAVNSGDMAKAEKLLRTRRGKDGKKLSLEDQDELSTKLQSSATRLRDIKQRKENSGKTRDELFTNLRENEGLGDINDKNIGKYLKLLNQESKYKKSIENPLDPSNSTDNLKDLSLIITESYKGQTDRVLGKFEEAIAVLLEIKTGVKQDGTSTDPNSDHIGLTDLQNTSNKKTDDKRQSVQDRITSTVENTVFKAKDQLKGFYSPQALSSIEQKIGQEPEKADFISKIARSGKAFSEGSLNKIFEMNKDQFEKVEKLSKYTHLDDEMIDALKIITDRGFNNILKLAKLNYNFDNIDIFNKIRVLDNDRLKRVINIFKKFKNKYSLDEVLNMSIVQYRNLMDNNKIANQASEGISNRLREEQERAANASQDEVNRTNPDQNREEPQPLPVPSEENNDTVPIQQNASGAAAVRMNAISAVSAGEMIIPQEENNTMMQRIFSESQESNEENTDINKDQLSVQEQLLAEQRTSVGLLGQLVQKMHNTADNAKSKTRSLLTKYGVLRFKTTTDGSETLDNDSETQKVKAAQDEENGTQKGILAKLGGFTDSVTGFFKNIFGKDKDEKKGGFLSSIFKSLGKTALKALLVATGIGMLPIMVDFWNQKFVPFFTNAWNDKIYPFLNTTFGGLGVKIATFATEVVTYVKSLPDRLESFWDNKLVPWFTGTGNYKDAGLPGLFSNHIIPFYVRGFEFLMTDVAPAIANILVKTLPGILVGALKGFGQVLTWDIGNLFKMNPKSKPEKKELAIDRGNSETENASSSVASFFSDFLPNGYKASGKKAEPAKMHDASYSDYKYVSEARVKEDKNATLISNTYNNTTSTSTVVPTSPTNPFYDGKNPIVKDKTDPTNTNTNLIRDEVTGKLVDKDYRTMSYDKDKKLYYDSKTGGYYNYNKETQDYEQYTGSDNLKIDAFNPGDGKESTGEALAGAGVRSFFRGSAGAVGALSKINVLGGLSKVPMLGAAVIPTKIGLKGIGTGASGLANLGQKILPGSIIGGAKAAEQAATRAIASGAGEGAQAVISQLGGREAAQALGKEQLEALLKEGAENSLKYSTNAAVKGAVESSAESALKRASQKAADNILKEVIEETGEKGLIPKFIKWIPKALDDLFKSPIIANTIGKLASSTGAGVKMAGGAVKSLCKTISGKMGKALAKLIGETAVKSIGKATAKLTAAVGTAGLATIVFAVADFVSGMSNADSIMGVTRKTTLMEKIIAGLVKAINGFITFGLIPESFIYDIAINIIAPLFKIDTTAIDTDREAAQLEVDQYNFEHGTDYDVSGYNRKDKLLTKIGTNVSKGFDATKDFFAGKVNEETGERENGLGTRIASSAKQLGSNIAAGASNAWDATKQFGSNIKTGAIDSFNTAKEWAGNSLDKAKELGSNAWDATKQFGSSVVDKTKELGSKAWDATKQFGSNVVDTAKDTANLMTMGILDDKEIRRQLGLDEDTKIELKDRVAAGASNFLETITFGKIDAEDSIKTIHGIAVTIENKAKETWTNIKDKTKEIFDDTVNAVKNVNKALDNKLGSILGLTDDEGNPVSLTESAKLTFDKAIEFSKETWTNIKDKAKESWTNIKDNTKEMFDNTVNYIKEAPNAINDWLGATLHLTDDDGNPVSLTESAKLTFDKTKEVARTTWTNIKDTTSNAWNTVSSNVSEMFDNTVNYIKEAPNAINDWLGATLHLTDDEGNPVSLTESAGLLYDKTKEAARTTWTNIKDTTSNAWTTIKDTTSEFFDKFKEMLPKALTKVDEKLGALLGFVDDNGKSLSISEGIEYNWDKTKTKLSEGWTSFKDKGKDFWDGISGWFGNIKDSLVGASEENTVKRNSGRGGFGSSKPVYGMGGDLSSGHVSQKDPKIANIRYNRPDDTIKQSMEDSGCAPAAATEVINKFAGKSITAQEAANYAIDNNFKERNGGTNHEYFNSIFNKYGIKSKYIESSDEITQNVSMKKPVILMGQSDNNSNTSPFGTTPHYVIASGTDDKGNIIIQDPNSRKSDTVYSMDKVLKQVKTGITIPSLETEGYGRSRIPYKSNNKFKVSKFNTSLAGFGRSATNVNDIIHQNLGSFSRLSASEMNAWINSKSPSGSPFRNNASIFIQASEESGLDPRYILAHAALESAWGTSNIAKKKNNYFGIGAYDSSPYESAFTFSAGLAASVIEGAKWISKNYYNSKYKQTTLRLMNYNNQGHSYATDKNWNTKIAKIMSSAPTNTNISYDTNSINSITGELDSSILTNSFSSSNSNGEKKGNIFDELTNLGTSILKARFGGDLVDALYGTTDNENSSGTNSSSMSLGTDPSNYTNADDWFLNKFKEGYVSAPFGESRKEGPHKGIDYGTNKVSAPIYSPISGVVTRNGVDKGYGNRIYIKDANAHEHVFAHMRELSPLKQGDLVKRGDFIGNTGNTGNSTGIHLHYQVNRPGSVTDAVDPNKYLAENSGLGPSDNRVNPLIDNSYYNTRYESSKPISIKSERELDKKTNYNNREIGGSTTSDISDYTKLLNIIIEVLLSISTNTEKLTKVLDILNDKYKLGIEKKDLDTSNISTTKERLKRVMNKQQRISNESPVGMGKEIMNKDTEYLLSTMTSIARE